MELWDDTYERNLMLGFLVLAAFVFLHLTLPSGTITFYAYLIPWFLTGYISFSFFHNAFLIKKIKDSDNVLKTKLKYEYRVFWLCSLFVIGLTIYPGLNNLLYDFLSVPYFVAASQMIILPFKIWKYHQELAESKVIRY